MRKVGTGIQCGVGTAEGVGTDAGSEGGYGGYGGDGSNFLKINDGTHRTHPSLYSLKCAYFGHSGKGHARWGRGYAPPSSVTLSPLSKSLGSQPDRTLEEPGLLASYKVDPSLGTPPPKGPKAPRPVCPLNMLHPLRAGAEPDCVLLDVDSEDCDHLVRLDGTPFACAPDGIDLQGPPALPMLCHIAAQQDPNSPKGSQSWQ